jgi:predicted transcriptional regulator
MEATPPGDIINSGEIMKYVTIRLDDEDFELLLMAKGDRTWREYIMKDVLNHKRRQQLQIMANGRGDIC